MDLAKLILEAGATIAADTLKPTSDIVEDKSGVESKSGVASRPQHANHVGYTLQVQYSDTPGHWYWWDDGAYDPYTFESANTRIDKLKQLDYPQLKFRIVGVVEVS